MGRIEALKKTEADGVYITSRANIFYYSGFTSEDAALIITADRQILLTDSRYTLQAKRQAGDFEIITDGMDKTGLCPKSLGIEENYITYAQCERIKKAFPGIELIPMGAAISEQREVKDKDERERLKRAEELADAAFSYILTILKTGQSEKYVAYEIENFMRKNGASDVAFETIVASGVRSAMPHGVASDKIIESGDLVTMDFGCILDGYCSDMTRTVVMGNASSRQREIYSVVRAAQEAGIAAAKQGTACREVDAAARRIIEDAGYGKYFTHSLGHSVGLEIHERPYFSPRSEQTLKEGNAITVEPGIYIEDFGGVRIEDVVIIGKDFTENITKSKKDLIII